MRLKEHPHYSTDGEEKAMKKRHHLTVSGYDLEALPASEVPHERRLYLRPASLAAIRDRLDKETHLRQGAKKPGK
jgi:hypothetical protein